MSKLATLVCFALLISATLAVSRSYTLFKQCNSAWGNERLGTGPKTVCQAGCAISSVAMILNTYGLKVSGAAANPGNFNKYLTGHGGYASGDLLIWSATNALGLPYQGSYSGSGSAISNFDANKNVVLNVNNGGHFVLMTGHTSSTTFLVNDPGFSKTQYSSSEVVGIRVYSSVSKTALEQLFDNLGL